MSTRNFFSRLRLPLIQAPMAGGITTPSLVAAVSAEGNAIGSFGFAYSSPQKITKDLQETVRLLSQKYTHKKNDCPTNVRPVINANFFIFPTQEEIIRNIKRQIANSSPSISSSSSLFIDKLSRSEVEQEIERYINSCLNKIQHQISRLLSIKTHTMKSVHDNGNAVMGQEIRKLEEKLQREYEQLGKKFKTDILSVLSDYSTNPKSLNNQNRFIPYQLEDQLEAIWQFVQVQQQREGDGTTQLPVIELLLSFHFGLPSLSVLEKARKLGIKTGVTVTNIEEVRQVLSLPSPCCIDFIVVQGIEAGGHRGNFYDNSEQPDDDNNMLMLDLVQSVVSLVKQSSNPPLIVAAGGIMNGHDINHALLKGADAVQLGTAFLCCEEAGTSISYRKALLQSSSTSHRRTKFTRTFSGRYARGIVNEFMTEMEKDNTDILPFPLQHTATTPLRQLANHLNNSEFQSLWAGTNYAQCRTTSASALLKQLEMEWINSR